MCYQQLNRKVFNCFLNTSREMSGDRSSAGKLFQTAGPCTAKLYGCRRLSLYVAQWVGLLWRIASWIVQFVMWPVCCSMTLGMMTEAHVCKQLPQGCTVQHGAGILTLATWPPGDIKKKEVKEVDLYSAFIEVPHTQGAQVQITHCYLQTTPYLPLPRKHSPDGASQTEVADI